MTFQHMKMATLARSHERAVQDYETRIETTDAEREERCERENLKHRHGGSPRWAAQPSSSGCCNAGLGKHRATSAACSSVRASRRIRRG